MHPKLAHVAERYRRPASQRNQLSKEMEIAGATFKLCGFDPY
jgi:hypothetical protein